MIKEEYKRIGFPLDGAGLSNTESIAVLTDDELLAPRFKAADAKDHHRLSVVTTHILVTNQTEVGVDGKRYRLKAIFQIFVRALTSA